MNITVSIDPPIIDEWAEKWLVLESKKLRRKFANRRPASKKLHRKMYLI
jgi:hypothetical protein